jgi:nitronate monooxygenase
MVAGVTCGAGMPYKLSEIAAQYGVYYLPIISSAPRLPCLVEARLSQGARMAGGGGL